jgi:putative transposase
VDKHKNELPVTDLCNALSVCARTYYRSKKEKIKKPRVSHRALGPLERYIVLLVLVSDDYVDNTPSEVFYHLLDQGLYLCSVSVMYDVLRQAKAARERRRQRKHPKYKKPQLKATNPNQVWTWDITKIKGPAKREYYNLYVIIDMYSRMVVGWTIDYVESEFIACDLISRTCEKQNIRRDHLTIHADRGAAMKSKSVGSLMADLGVTKSHSRPRVSNDNAYSESQFKTLKYHRSYPGKFDSIAHARTYMAGFFDWYNTNHYHSGIAMHTPQSVHFGLADAVTKNRKSTMEKIIQENPNRFVKGKNSIKNVPNEVWINQPSQNVLEAA